MEVMVQVHNTDFDFKTAESSPYSTIPSTPTRIGDYYYSAPTSPSRVSSCYYQDFDDFLVVNEDEIVKDCGASVPFKWEEKPGKPKYLSQLYKKSQVDDFMFDVSQGMERSSVSADEIFDGGKIRPHFSNQENDERVLNREKRRRIRGSHRRAQSVGALAPEKTPEYESKEEESKQPEVNKESESESSSSSKGFSKWSFKDLFLFRSASEGRASYSEKDPLQKYMPFYKKQEFYKRSSFRAIDSPNGSRSGSMRHVSAHELHYTLNRAVSEDLKKKTFLPYKQGILGRLAFNPALHAIANGFGISHR